MSSADVKTVPLKFIGRIVSGGTPRSDDSNWGGDLPFVTPPDLNGLDGARISAWERSLTSEGAADSSVVRDAVLLSCRAPIGHIGIALREVAFNQGCKAIIPVDRRDLRYLAYGLVGARKALETAGRGTTFTELSTSALGSLSLPWPEASRRSFLADYLDGETRRIGAMLDRLADLAVKLRERRGAAWSSVYARGFETRRLQWLMDEVDERAEQRYQGLPLLSVSIHHGVQRREESTSRQQASTDLSKYKVARRGDIALNRMRAFQGGLGQARIDGLVSPDYAVLRPREGLTADWAEYVMRSPTFVDEMSQWLRGIGAADQSKVRTPRINVRDLMALSIPMAASDELGRVTGELDETTARIDAMLAKVAQLESLLLERRAALITDVVTGRKDVA